MEEGGGWNGARDQLSSAHRMMELEGGSSLTMAPFCDSSTGPWDAKRLRHKV